MALTLRQKIQIKFFFFKYGVYGLILASMAIVAYFSYRELEALAMFVSYVLIRNTFKKTWHSKSFFRCAVTSMIVFWAIIPLTLPFYVSIFGSIIIAYFLDLALFYVQDYFDLLIEIEQIRIEIQRLSVKYENPRAEFLYELEMLKIRQKEHKFILTSCFIDNMKPKDIMTALYKKYPDYEAGLDNVYLVIKRYKKARKELYANKTI